ncbi:hypothetical protein SAMD00023353_1200700 [Rosellinia necatrix]|uniref:Uncharacterized protein n=1 Tax=Rosellinia necatrix TaxID=77044 RepID=A0A1S8A6V3_ROSNE|nr:hypothetical protein SAMD00023353_1200700 [Rosellinia necatrix]
MLLFRNRTSHNHGGRLESRKSLPSIPATSSLGRKLFPTGGKKNLVRGRLRGLTGNTAERCIPRYDGDRVVSVPGTWYDAEPKDNTVYKEAGRAQHVEVAGQTWPEIRKSISSMASSLRISHASSSRRSGQECPQHSSGRSGVGFGAPRKHARRWATITGHSGFGNMPEVFLTPGREVAPQLPGLAGSDSFLESLTGTGLFQTSVLMSEANGTAGNATPFLS